MLIEILVDTDNMTVDINDAEDENTPIAVDVPWDTKTTLYDLIYRC